MIPTQLFVTAILYDVFEDAIFEVQIPVQRIALKFYNRAHKNLNDLEELSFSGKVTNTAEGSILLGSL